MANHEPKLLLAVLKELTAKELKEFQWHLSQENWLDGFQHIPKGDLENADRQDTVDIMIRTYRNAPAVEITLRTLKDINQNNLADRLSRDYNPTESPCNHGSLSLVAPLTVLRTTPGLTMLPALTFRAEVRLLPMEGNKVRVEVIPESMTTPSLAHAGSSMTPGGFSMALQSSSNAEDRSHIVCNNAQDHNQTPNEHIKSNNMLTKLNEYNKIRINMLGSGSVGKSCMVSTFLTNRFPSEYVPSVFDKYVKDIGDEGCFGSLEIQDITGLSDYDRLRRLSYPLTDVFLVCFSVVYPDSFKDVDMKWVPEINHYCPGTPFLLVGTQIDLRKDPHTLERLAKKKQKPINSEIAKKLASDLKAFKYVECSALTQEGLKNVFDEVIQAVLRSQQFKKNKCVLS